MIKRHVIAFLINLLIINVILAQEPLPTDYLSKDFHKGRREALRKLMPPNSVVAIFSFPERVFSLDVNYAYHPNPDLYYFSGYKESESILLIFKEPQQTNGNSYNELFFVRKRNPLEEQWTGRRLGAEGVKAQLGFDQVFDNDRFADYPIDFSKFDKVIYDFIPDDLGPGPLLSMIKKFRERANIQKPENKNVAQSFNSIVNYTTPSNLQARVARLKSKMAETDDDEFKSNSILQDLINHPDTVTLFSVIKKIKNISSPTMEYNKLVAGLREIKMPEELALLRKSIFLSATAHNEAMKAIKPEMSESELSGLFQYVHKKYGSEEEGYAPIVGAGANGCILHYIENNVTQLKNQLVLMDVGAQYHGYTADITRTVPANGKFTAEQKAIYQLVYDAQEAVFQICKEGTPFRQLNEKATESLANGLIKLGIIKDRKDVSLYYIHGCSHHLGLDVHDKNITPILKENMVITVEPGIYIPKGSPCDRKWWDIAVRIEDDVVIGKNGFENLSKDSPRKVEEVEKMVEQKSVFNDLVLPTMGTR
jgi:Xaa-Pro aminopeptidase